MFLRRLSLAALLLATLFSVRAQLSFQPLVVSSNRLQLVLLGNTGSAYAIEKSSNLVNWTTLFSSIASNGRVEFDGPLPSDAAQFFRGRPDSEPVSIVPKINPTQTTQLFATQEGSTSVLDGTNGVRFTLDFPSNNIVTPTTVTMTLVTNMTGLPFAAGMLGAVQIGPNDPELFGAAKLTMSIPAGVDRRRIVTFAANPEGSDFSLTPSRITTNGVVIPIIRTGIIGAALATTQEIAQVQPPASFPLAQQLSAKKSSAQTARAPLPTSVLCFPTLVARAATIRAEIQRALRRQQHDLSVIIGIERQRQLVGVESDTSDIFSQVGPLSCAFYNEHIAPHWPETASNCSLTKVLLEAALGLERQMQMFGVPDEERCTANILSAQTLCPGFKACLKEIEACCLTGHQERQRLIDLATLVRQQAVLGIENNTALGCFDLNDDITKGVIDVCTKSIWTGTIRVTDNGAYYEREVYVNGFREFTDNYNASGSAFAHDSTEQIFPGFGLTATIKLSGAGTAHSLYETYSEIHNQCGTGFTRDKSEGSASSPAAFQANLSVQGTNYNIGILFLGTGDEQTFWLPGEERDEYTDVHPGGSLACGPGSNTYRTSTSAANFLLPSLVMYSGSISGGDTNTITGSTNYTATYSQRTNTITINWDFQRSKSGQ